MTDPNIPVAASLRAWLDARRAEIEHDHRDSWMGRDDLCYCDLPKPCPDRERELAAVDGLVAVLNEREQLLSDEPVGDGRKPLTKRELATIGLTLSKPAGSPDSRSQWDHATVRRLYWALRYQQGVAIRLNLRVAELEAGCAGAGSTHRELLARTYCAVCGERKTSLAHLNECLTTEGGRS